MKLIGLLGLLVLLGAGWAISYHPRGVRLRPVVWGVVLQLLLGLTVLRDDVWSFVGMSLVGLLVVGYLADHGGHGLELERRGTGVALVGAAAVGALLIRLPAPSIATLAPGLTPTQ